MIWCVAAETGFTCSHDFITIIATAFNGKSIFVYKSSEETSGSDDIQLFACGFGLNAILRF